MLRLDGLLIEAGTRTAARKPAAVADWHKVAFGVSLQPRQPSQGPEATLHHFRPVEGFTRDDERLGQKSIRIGESVLGPRPVLVCVLAKDVEQAVSEIPANAPHVARAIEPLQIGVGADQA